MKKLILLISLLVITSCNTSGTNKDECLKTVGIRFPNSKIYGPPNGTNTRFIVIDSTSIRLVITGNLKNTDITSIVILEQLNK